MSSLCLMGGGVLSSRCRDQKHKGRRAFDGRPSSVDFLPMTLRTRFLITALFFCHSLLVSALVTSRLHAGAEEAPSASVQDDAPKSQAPIGTPCTSQVESDQDQEEGENPATICALQQEKDGDVYKLHGDVEIHYRRYVLRADEVTYDSASGEATA